MSEVGKSETAKREEEVLAYWKESQIFEKTLSKHAPRGKFIFYDGPPFATGLPHVGNLLSSVVKDLVGRYKTMQGHHVPRVWGWDCHGLPVESLVEKKLGLKTKKDILTIGIDVFNEEARASVLQYVDEWEKYVDRIGRFVDFKNSYKTMDNSYIESVWWALKKLNSKKLLYEGRKVLMYCTHCETPLAKAEIAMDHTYKDITEEAVTVKFKLTNAIKYGLPESTYMLAWTTTPWTLPGNVGLAVGPDILYVLVEHAGEHYVIAKDRAEQIKGDVAGEFLGKQLIGAQYEPLYHIAAVEGHKGRKHTVLGADFVTTTEGTGVVHTAVMYGEDDFALGQKEGLPMVQLLNPNGTYNDLVPEFIRGEYIKKAEKLIKADLEHRTFLFSTGSHTHSYPHCYRCGTPLIYNAVGSWFINIQKVKAKMLSENEKITWVPEHLKHGRFKHIVESAPDWTISRNRFWASPLPIWKEKKGGGVMVVESIEELLQKTKRSGNTYFVMRHGGAESNKARTTDSHGDPHNTLTDAGRRTVRENAEKLDKKAKIDLIIVSPLLRARETAKIAQKALNVPDSAVMVDERLREIEFGSFGGGPVQTWDSYFKSTHDRFVIAPEGAENLTQVRRRTGDVLFELERRYVNKNILIISHGDPLWVMAAVAEHKDSSRVAEEKRNLPETGEVQELPFVPFPHNANFELDLHRPYIDAITLVDRKGRQYERIPEVIDCWVESGAMPIASMGYPKDKNRVNPSRLFGLWPKGYPGDFIAEYIAQTRTWFYYMHAIGILLFGRLSFKAVVSTGTILAADGSKMSKSKGNYTDPLNIMHMFGADALRFHLLQSVVMQSEDLNFRDEDVREAHNRVIQILWNSYKFFELYKEEYDGSAKAEESVHVLDRWALSRLAQVTNVMTEALDAYDTPTAARAFRNFIEDYSTWYVRRSRDRVKGEDESDKQYSLATQRTVLLMVAKLAAPIMPFIAESLYRSVGGEKEESVHLVSWPAAGNVDETLLADMIQIRTAASQGLKAREEAGIKIRQPLAMLKVKTLPNNTTLLAVLGQEVNVKEVVQDGALKEDVWLDTELTPALREEGVVRGLIRRVQEWRKESGLTISDRPSHTLVVSSEEKDIAEKHRAAIARETGLKDLTISIS